MTSREDLAKDYRAAFFRYLPRREESALASAYDIGRRAMSRGLTLLDLVEVHHETLIEVLRDARQEEVVALARAGSEIFLEAAAAFDMANRAVTERSGDPTRERPARPRDRTPRRPAHDARTPGKRSQPRTGPG